MSFARTAVVSAMALTFGLASAAAEAAPRHHRTAASHNASVQHAGVRFAARTSHGGYQPLVSDGPGTGLGFHRLPGPYRIGARIQRDRQADALRETVAIDALTHGSYRSGFLGDNEYASTPYSTYGVFSGADGYGSPYFAGYYGPGDGEDLGPLGHTYADSD